jgi:hypothetical protein
MAGTTVMTVRRAGFATGINSAAMTFRLLLGVVKEPGQDGGPVLGREHASQGGHGGYAKTAVSQEFDDLGVALDQLGCLVAEEGCGLRELQSVGQEGEETRIAQLDPSPALVELREGDEEVGHGVALVPEEVGEAGGEGSALGGVHAESISWSFSNPVRRAGQPAGALETSSRRLFSR